MESAVLWQAYTVNMVAVGITFQVRQWGAAYEFNADKWCCYYWDPGRNNFIGNANWYNLPDSIQFSDVQPGGYFAVFLLRDSQTSSQYTSPTFQAVDGGIYQFDLNYLTVTKVG